MNFESNLYNKVKGHEFLNVQGILPTVLNLGCNLGRFSLLPGLYYKT